MIPVVRPDRRWAIASFHPAYLVWRSQDEEGKAMDELKPLLSNDVRRTLTCCEPRVPAVRVSVTGQEALRAWGAAPAPTCAVDIEGGMGSPTQLNLCWKAGEAWVLPWSDTARDLLRAILGHALPVFHNANYDLPELLAAGVAIPPRWVDTINLAALFDPSLPLNLQAQTLTHVPGSVAWKGLINHKKGYEYCGKAEQTYVDLWTETLTRLGRKVPTTREAWFWFYGGLDAGYTFDLAQGLKKALEEQGRFGYYQTVMEPLQRPLLEMGLAGMPVDQDRVEHHQRACQRLQRMASRILKDAAQEMMTTRVAALEQKVEATTGKERTALRAKLRAAREAESEGFNFDSFPQRAALLYDWLGLPPVKNRKTGRPTTDDKAVETLISRLARTTEDGRPAPTIKPKRGSISEAVRVLKAMAAGKKWATWERGYLRPAGGQTILRTTYSQHRTDTGRLASGVDDSDMDKGKRGGEAHLQNVPKKLRDIVVAPEGYVFLGADYAGIEWALTMYFAGKVGSGAFYDKMLDGFYEGRFDPHRYLAAFAYGVPESEVQPWQRQVAKKYTHGRDFLGSPGGLAAEAGHPRAVGEKVCAAHDRAFRLPKWWEYMQEQVKKLKRVQTPLGWRRYWWGWKPKPNEIMATQIQATAADLCKWTLLNLRREMPHDSKMSTSTHDSFLLLVPVGVVEERRAWLKGVMERPVPWLGGRKWRCDVKVGKNWRSVS